jgi:hypothetical protein
MINYKITGLKLPQLSTGILQKNLNAITEKPEKAPDWMAIGKPYLITKSGDNKEVIKYRPITC